MNKFKQMVMKQFRMGVSDIAMAGILVAIWIISSRFISIDFGMMRAGITYAIAIVVGLYFKPALAFLIAIVGDTISLMITDGIGFWMWQYAIIYPLLVLLVSFIKWIYSSKKEKIWFSFSIITFMITIVGAVLVSILNNNFVNKGHQNTFDFNQIWLKILIWVMIFIMLIVFIIFLFLYKKSKNKNIKFLIMTYSIVSLVIVLFIWIWGPYADLEFTKRFYNGNISVSKMYKPYLILRVFKTPIILPLYTAIVYPLYKIKEVIVKTGTSSKWK